jgi:hypothetical protein
MTNPVTIPIIDVAGLFSGAPDGGRPSSRNDTG